MKQLALLISLLAILGACQPKESAPPPANSATNSKKAPMQADADIEALLAKMTVEEKVGQMAQLTLDVITEGKDVYTSNEPLKLDADLVREAIVKYHVGSILNTANNRARSVETWREIVGSIQKVATEETRLGIPVIYGVDAIHGATYTAGATFFPQQIGQAATWNTQLVQQGAAICAYETRACAIPWNFSPVLDMGRDARFPRLWETFGESTYLTTQMGVAMVKGYEGPENNIGGPTAVASCLKHFLGYGTPNSGKDRTPATISNLELREKHMAPFKAAIDAGAHTIMINSGLINGLPVHASKRILTNLLKEELGFTGLVVTDWADVENLHSRDRVAATSKEAVKMAVNAGIDMAMIPYSYQFCTDLVALVNEGEVPMERIDDAVRRILVVKKKLGLFEAPTLPNFDYKDFASQEFQQAAYQTAVESMTLLKNNDNILPLRAGTNVAVIGPNGNSMRSLNGGWSYSWQGEKVEAFAGEYNTIFEAIKAANQGGNTTYTPGVAYKQDGKYWEDNVVDMQAAVQAARQADVVLLCLGENSYTEKPGDLHELALSDNQLQLAMEVAKAGKPIVLVLNEGRPRLIRRIEPLTKAVVQTYLPGNYGGNGLAAVLFGQENFSGKLPYTYPMYGNTVLTYDHKPSENQNKMSGAYDYESDFAVQYPFGFGLSYTTYAYSGMKVNSANWASNGTLTISVTVKNTGKRAGKEVVQLYVGQEYGPISPDVRRLIGFEKVSLEAGASQEVQFTVAAQDLARLNAELQQVFTAGKYTFIAGLEKASATFEVKESQTYTQFDPVVY